MPKKRLSQTGANRKWQVELNKLMEQILLGNMTEGEATKYLVKSVNKLNISINNSVDFEHDVKMAVSSYFKIYKAHVPAEVIDKQVKLAANYQRKEFNKLTKSLPKELRSTVRNNMRMVSNLLATGDITEAQAVKQVLGQQQGVRVQTKKQGSWKVQNLLNQHLRETLKETCQDIAEVIADELGTDTYYVPGHAGAREGCEYAQENYYSDTLDGMYVVDGAKVRIYPWSQAWSQQIYPGLFDINCRHMKFPVTPLIPMNEIRSEGEGSLKDLKKAIESKDVVFN